VSFIFDPESSSNFTVSDTADISAKRIAKFDVIFDIIRVSAARV